jgi:hypothetical protein
LWVKEEKMDKVGGRAVERSRLAREEGRRKGRRFSISLPSIPDNLVHTSTTISVTYLRVCTGGGGRGIPVSDIVYYTMCRMIGMMKERR